MYKVQVMDKRRQVWVCECKADTLADAWLEASEWVGIGRKVRVRGLHGTYRVRMVGRFTRKASKI